MSTAALVTLRGGSTARVYAVGAVPATPNYPYVVIGYAPNSPQVRTLDGSGDPMDRFTVQHFGKTAAAVEAAASETFDLFDGQTVLGQVCWQETASPIYRDPDAQGVLSVTHTFRF